MDSQKELRNIWKYKNKCQRPLEEIFVMGSKNNISQNKVFHQQFNLPI